MAVRVVVRKRKRSANTKSDALDLRQLLEEKCRDDTNGDILALTEIISGGQKARNAQSRVKAIALKWSYGFGQPSQPLSLQTPDGKELTLRIKRDRK